MVLKIVLQKMDYTPQQLEKIADVMIRKGDGFTDSGQHGTYTVGFAGSKSVSRLAQTRRAIFKVAGVY